MGTNLLSKKIFPQMDAELLMNNIPGGVFSCQNDFPYTLFQQILYKIAIGKAAALNNKSIALFHAVTQDKLLPRLDLIRLQMNTIKGGIGF